MPSVLILIETWYRDNDFKPPALALSTTRSQLVRVFCFFVIPAFAGMTKQSHCQRKNRKALRN